MYLERIDRSQDIRELKLAKYTVRNLNRRCLRYSRRCRLLRSAQVTKFFWKLNSNDFFRYHGGYISVSSNAAKIFQISDLRHKSKSKTY